MFLPTTVTEGEVPLVRSSPLLRLVNRLLPSLNRRVFFSFFAAPLHRHLLTPRPAPLRPPLHRLHPPFPLLTLHLLLHHSQAHFHLNRRRCQLPRVCFPSYPSRFALPPRSQPPSHVSVVVVVVAGGGGEAEGEGGCALGCCEEELKGKRKNGRGGDREEKGKGSEVERVRVTRREEGLRGLYRSGFGLFSFLRHQGERESGCSSSPESAAERDRQRHKELKLHSNTD